MSPDVRVLDDHRPLPPATDTAWIRSVPDSVVRLENNKSTSRQYRGSVWSTTARRLKTGGSYGLVSGRSTCVCKRGSAIVTKDSFVYHRMDRLMGTILFHWFAAGCPHVRTRIAVA